MDTAGDGFFAAFDDPGAALDCALEIARAVAPLGLTIRAAVHVGEVIPSDGKVGGIAVSTAARLLALAGPGEVLVSSTLRELVAGSDHEFQDRGVHQLRGVPGEWHVYAVVPREFEAEPAVATRRAIRRIPGAAVAFVTVALVIAAVAAAVALGRPRFSPRADSVVALSVGSGDVVGGAFVGRGPLGVAADGQAAWVASVDSGTVTRIASDGSTESFGSVGDHPAHIAVLDGRAWVSDPYEGRLTVLTATGQATPLRDVRARQLAAGLGAVWLVDDVRDRVLRLDPATGRTSATIQLPAGSGPATVAVGPDAVWVGATTLRRLFRIDPRQVAVVEETALSDPPSAIAWIAGSLWVVSRASDRVVRIGGDGSTLRVEVGDTPAGIAGDDRGVWISSVLEQRVWQLALDGSIVRQMAVAARPAGVAVAGDRVWVALRSN